MNIFYLSHNTKLAAQFHHDFHITKMLTETSQILSTAIWILDCNSAETFTGWEYLYFPTHEHHPSTRWAAESKANFEYTLWLFSELHNEYRHRKGKKHMAFVKTWGALAYWFANYPHKFPNTEWTTPALAMPEEYKTDDPITSYRNYYVSEKVYTKSGKFMATYTNRKPPFWFPEAKYVEK